MKKPNFFIIGSVKCGTTTLYSYLKKSPEVFLPVQKEPHYFITCSNDLNYKGLHDHQFFKNYPTDITEYEALFSEADKEKIVGEASAMYMYYPNVARHIYNYSPDAKIIGIIRNPVERAYSHFLHQIRDGMETVDHFYDAIIEEIEGKRENWAPQRRYVEFGRYSKQLERYYNIFPEAQIKIFKFEDFISDPNKVLSEICSFLEIEDIFQNITVEKHNTSGVPVFKEIHFTYLKVIKIIRKIAPFLTNSRLALLNRKIKSYYFSNFLEKPEMCLKSRNLLQKLYFNEIEYLEKYFKLNLKSWK